MIYISLVFNNIAYYIRFQIKMNNKQEKCTLVYFLLKILIFLSKNIKFLFNISTVGNTV